KQKTKTPIHAIIATEATPAPTPTQRSFEFDLLPEFPAKSNFST
ncbi:hypothetical protein A2U01_0091105, partial [Trifolium medium]|nr:hypothetical protein [Trifolium medium]